MFIKFCLSNISITKYNKEYKYENSLIWFLKIIMFKYILLWLLLNSYMNNWGRPIFNVLKRKKKTFDYLDVFKMFCKHCRVMLLLCFLITFSLCMISSFLTKKNNYTFQIQKRCKQFWSDISNWQCNTNHK